MIENRVQSTENRKQKGAVLILTFIVMATLTAIVAAFLFMTSIQTKAGGYDIASHKALWLAEAGIQQVIYQLKTDSGYRANPTTVTGNLGSGSYSVTVSKNASTYTFTSAGTVSVLNRRVTQTVIVSELPEAYSYAVYVGGRIRSDDAENLNITGSQKANGTNFPTVDFTYYQGQAPPSQRISGNYTFNAGTYSGIWYITGNVVIQDNVTINGTVVTLKKITCSNKENVSINPNLPNPSLIANDEIDFSKTQHITINGLIYAGADGSGKFDLQQAETANITGTIIAAGDIDLRQSDHVTITYNASIITNPPPGISGGGGTASVLPQKDWNEISAI